MNQKLQIYFLKIILTDKHIFEHLTTEYSTQYITLLPIEFLNQTDQVIARYKQIQRDYFCIKPDENCSKY
jgi:hypothetical protein